MEPENEKYVYLVDPRTFSSILILIFLILHWSMSLNVYGNVASSGECSEGVCDQIQCQNGGQCTARSADTHVCLCPLGFHGINCENGEFCGKNIESFVTLSLT